MNRFVARLMVVVALLFMFLLATVNLPNTGGPPAVVLPIALGAIVLGAVLVARRRPAPGRHRG